ncbi:PilZ domain-containing protein [Microvirga tunisiensis]|uniref:PilZ domain-containing protein n=1 Tax=Pannonibacter tanglangensis TaxID=2750084 RepID=A0A7X5F5K1_9HYPH|nr:PilZ domain-containing protein [Pannonibacter sp. XCT-53]NBN78909.1 PilZ domain-containing protein [Pannonibacter sp. XCT-53]
MASSAFSVHRPHAAAVPQAQPEVERVLVFDVDRLTCIEAEMSNVSQWGCRLTSDDAALLGKSIGIRVGDDPYLRAATVTSVTGTMAAVVFSAQSDAAASRRQEPRRPVSIPIVVTDREGSMRVSGRIVDASKSGCRISAPGLAKLPDEIVIRVLGMPRALVGKIMRREGDEAGVRLNWEAVRELASKTQKLARPPV